MITKTLLTLAIVIAVYIWFRAQKSKHANYNAEVQGRLLADESAKNTWLKPLLYVLTAFAIVASISLSIITLGLRIIRNIRSLLLIHNRGRPKPLLRLKKTCEADCLLRSRGEKFGHLI